MQKFSNMAASVLDNTGGIDSVSTLVELRSGEGNRFADIALGSSDFELLTLFSGSAWEVVKVTQRSGDNLTVQRAYEGQAQSWPKGTPIVSSVTKSTLQDYARTSGASARVYMHKNFR